MNEGDRADQRFAAQGKPVAAICHGPWLLIEPICCAVGRRPAALDPNRPAQCRRKCGRRAAVTDGNIVTSRNPNDVEAFTNAVIDLVEDARGHRTSIPANCQPNRLARFVRYVGGHGHAFCTGLKTSRASRRRRFWLRPLALRSAG
jgi:hypothetical protein